MNEAELDALVERLVPEFERTKQQALEARRDFLAMNGQVWSSRDDIALAHARWQALEARCQEILNQIDWLAERNAA